MPEDRLDETPVPAPSEMTTQERLIAALDTHSAAITHAAQLIATELHKIALALRQR